MELAILDFIQTHLRSGLADQVFSLITRFGDLGIFWMLLTALFLCIPKTRRLGCAMAISLLLESLIANLALKPLVARIRPCDVNTAVSLLVRRPLDYSFPSGHTGASFAAAGAMLLMKHRYRIPALVLASLIGFSRLYLYVHYPTDVLAGIGIGLVSAWLAVWIQTRFFRNPSTPVTPA